VFAGPSLGELLVVALAVAAVVFAVRRLGRRR
jgi:uncharacterized membrane protein